MRMVDRRMTGSELRASNLVKVLGEHITAIVSRGRFFASDHRDDVSRTEKAALVFRQIMDTPDKGRPNKLLEKAKCVAIIPGDK